MNLEKKFEKFLTLIVGDPELKDFIEDLIDSNVLSVVFPPVKLLLVVGDSYKLKITDGINSYVMHPNDIDDNMLQDIAKAYNKYAPEDMEIDSEDEAFRRDKAREEFMKRLN